MNVMLDEMRVVNGYIPLVGKVNRKRDGGKS
jgi:hypothetical protein